MTNSPAVYFYLPESYPLKDIPPDANFYTPGLYQGGVYCWVVQTYLHLRDNGFPCQITNTIPDEGIVLYHRAGMPENWQPKPKVLLVCLMADKEEHPLAQFHVVQNLQEPLLQEQDLWPSYFMPLWPQAGLIKRDPARGDRFENIAYLGRDRNLDPKLQDPAWAESLSKLGLTWNIIESDRWHDYSQIDAVLAVRSFTKQNFFYKPATKLYTAWHAGVPAIFGCETSVQSERKSELDYIEVKSIDQALAALQRLRDDLDWRKAIIENGRIRAQETDKHVLTARWQKMITELMIPEYERWCSMSPKAQQRLSTRRHFSLKVHRMKARMRTLVARVQAS